MTSTEDRLTDALHAAAGRVRTDRLRPLTAPARRRPRLARLLAPVGAAAGVAVAVALAFALSSLSGTTSHPRRSDHGPPPPALGWQPAPLPAPAGPPRYYAELNGDHTQIQIRATATGWVTGSVPNPPRTAGVDPIGVAAGASGEWFAVYDWGELAPNSWRKTELYRFQVTGAGRVARWALVRGGVFHGLSAAGFSPGGEVAISPDGSRAALATYSTYGHSTGKASTPEVAHIVVLNLRTGARQTWQGGLQRPGYGFSIPSISFAPGGRWLVFLASWCQDPSEDSFCGAGGHLAEVRTLSLASGGGSLAQGRVLLGESPGYPFIVQALLTPGGGSITAAVLRGSFASTRAQNRQELRVVQVPLTGDQPVLLYHGRLGDLSGMTLGSDRSGHYWIITGHANGWFRAGRLHTLAPGDYASMEAW